MSFSFKSWFHCWRETIALLFKGKQRAIGIDLMSIGEFQFCRSVIESLLARFPSDLLYIFHHENSEVEFRQIYPHLDGRLKHLPYRCLSGRVFQRLDLYITNEQFVTGPPGVYTLTLFHGQPSKGVTFNLHGLYPLLANDALFLYGPLQRQALDEHLALQQWTLPNYLSLFEIGYTKSDDLINGRFDRESILREMGLDPSRKTVLYAPAFNEGASLRECGLKILNILSQLPQYNILAKLPIDCMQPMKNIQATGGVNWFEAIGTLEKNYPNFRLFREHAADRALACSDVLITCVSSISFEFLALGRPVIFIEVPRFYETSLKAFFPDADISGFAQRTTVNGGKEFGLTVSAPEHLPQAIAEVLDHPDKYPPNKSALRDYLLYNAGYATSAAVNKIDELLANRVRSQRPKREVLSLLHRVRSKKSLIQVAGRNVRRLLNRYGYDITRVGSDFLNADTIVSSAKKYGLSVCEYLENAESDPRKRGRRDRIIAELEKAGVLQQINRVCEIGAGTGRYLEKVIDLVRPSTYEVYETNPGWSKFLFSEYNNRNRCKVTCHAADGCSLSYTASGSCDLIHAHAVFVYLPLLQSLAYLKECVRVCRPGGYIAFDYCPSETLTYQDTNAWLSGTHRFLVVIPSNLLEEFSRRNHLRVMHRFPMIYGESHVEYLIWQKSAVS